MENVHMILKSIGEPRKNWEAAFFEMHKNGDDKLLIDGVFDDDIREYDLQSIRSCACEFRPNNWK